MKKYFLMFALIMFAGMAYTNTSFSYDEYPTYLGHGSFSMQVANNTGEQLSNVSAFIYVLDNDNDVFREICKYEDETNCYLFQTDANGRIRGTFPIDEQYIIGETYTLEVTVGNITNTGTFTLQTRNYDTLSFNIYHFFQENFTAFALGMILLGVAIAFLVFIYGFIKGNF